MVIRTIEIGFEVEPERIEEVIKKIKELYPNLKVRIENGGVFVSGDLHNYKRRNMIMWILSGGKHGKNIQTN